MNAKHTPGPWSLTEPNGVGQGYSLKGPDAWFGYKPWSQETRANATLCAAAPDLLEALEPFAYFAEAVVRFAEGPGNFPKSGPIYALNGHGLDEREITVEHFRAALSAIAKARGEA